MIQPARRPAVRPPKWPCQEIPLLAKNRVYAMLAPSTIRTCLKLPFALYVRTRIAPMSPNRAPDAPRVEDSGLVNHITLADPARPAIPYRIRNRVRPRTRSRIGPMMNNDTMFTARWRNCTWVNTDVTTCHQAPLETPATQLSPFATQAAWSSPG